MDPGANPLQGQHLVSLPSSQNPPQLHVGHLVVEGTGSIVERQDATAGTHETRCLERIHGTGICTYVYHTSKPNVGKYTKTMDPMGLGCKMGKTSLLL